LLVLMVRVVKQYPILLYLIQNSGENGDDWYPCRTGWQEGLPGHWSGLGGAAFAQARRQPCRRWSKPRRAPASSRSEQDSILHLWHGTWPITSGRLKIIEADRVYGKKAAQASISAPDFW